MAQKSTERLKIQESKVFNESSFSTHITGTDKRGRATYGFRQSTVADFISELAKLPSDAHVTMDIDHDYGWSSSSSSSDAKLVVSWQRDETDEEYAARMQIIKDGQDRARKVANERRRKTKETELELLQKLIAKHGIPNKDKV